MNYSLMLLLVCGLAQAADFKPPAIVPATGIGWRGDGSGYFPDSNPPTTWSDSENVLWKAPRPNWGYAHPVPVGNRVFTISEAGWDTYTPTLVAYDADSGEQVFRVPINALDAHEFSETERKQFEDDQRFFVDIYKYAYRISKPLQAHFTAPQELLDEVNAKLSEKGMSMPRYRRNYGLLRYLELPEEAHVRNKRMRKHGLTPLRTWHRFGEAQMGDCFPTPVSDGERIFVLTNHGTVHAYDCASGKLLWARYSGFVQGGGCLMASPRMWNGMVLTPFISTSKAHSLIAWDPATGKEHWRVDLQNETGGERAIEARSKAGGSLQIMTIGETEVALASTGQFIRLADAKVLQGRLPNTCMTVAIDDEGDRVFGAGEADKTTNRWGVALSLAGDQVVIKEIYNIPESTGPKSQLYHNGRVYSSKVQLDAKTGLLFGQPAGKQPRIQRLRPAQMTAPETKSILLRTKTAVYGMQDYRETEGGRKGAPYVRMSGKGDVFSLDGKHIATNHLDQDLKFIKEDQWVMQGWRKGFSYSGQMAIDGDRLYICSDQTLYCIGKR